MIVPVFQQTIQLSIIRNQLTQSTTPCELLLIINNPTLTDEFTSQHANETIIQEPQQGRGYAFRRGVSIAQGDIILFLHADTILPTNWDRTITKTLEDTHVIGGGFSLDFDNPSVVLQNVTKITRILFQLTGELWGDRGIFIRASIMNSCLPTLNVPLFEDVRLSKCMRKQGRVKLVKPRVTTTTSSFQKHGRLQHMLRILTSRIWYALGGDVNTIYHYYYN